MSFSMSEPRTRASTSLRLGLGTFMKSGLRKFNRHSCLLLAGSGVGWSGMGNVVNERSFRCLSRCSGRSSYLHLSRYALTFLDFRLPFQERQEIGRAHV